MPPSVQSTCLISRQNWRTKDSSQEDRRDRREVTRGPYIEQLDEWSADELEWSDEEESEEEDDEARHDAGGRSEVGLASEQEERKLALQEDRTRQWTAPGREEERSEQEWGESCSRDLHIYSSSTCVTRRYDRDPEREARRTDRMHR